MWSEGDTLWEEKEFQLFRVYFVIFTSSCSVAVWITHKSVTFDSYMDYTQISHINSSVSTHLGLTFPHEI